MSKNSRFSQRYDPAMDRLQNALNFIEGNLTEALSVADVAGAACLSPFHFARTFRARTGWSVMAYVQARRLSAAADLLSANPPRLIDLAMDSGFESQATFTRAFKRKFLITPGAIKRQTDGTWRINLTLPLEINRRNGDEIMIAPAFVDLPAFRAAGLKGRFDENTRREIGDLWGRFMQLENANPGAIPGALAGQSYGICLPPSEVDGPFDYFAAVARTGNAALPEGIDGIEVPAQHYAVFTHKLDNPNVSDSVFPTIRYIWETWLPKSNYEYTGGPDFELYDARFKVDGENGPEGEFDIYVPVHAS